MNSYTEFSAIYDKLMNTDFNYGKIADFIENIFSRYDVDANLVCELACGTGNITLPLSKRGYDMIALDSSSEMLDIARKKASDENISDILFLNQNMTRLDLYGTVDAVICLIDGINYILDPNALFKMFKKIKTCFLEPGGVFLFDISSEHKLKNTIGDNTFIYNTDEIFYAWENSFSEKYNISDMFLTFFKKDKHNKYKRFSERHLQRAYSIDEIKRMLALAKFSQIDIYDGISFNKPIGTSERIVFCAR